MSKTTKTLNIKHRRALLSRVVGNVADFRFFAQGIKGQRAVADWRYQLTSWGMGQPSLCRIFAAGAA